MIFVFSRDKIGGVAPLAGAWIETATPGSFHECLLVAPLAGAWIETYENCMKTV